MRCGLRRHLAYSSPENGSHCYARIRSRARAGVHAPLSRECVPGCSIAGPCRSLNERVPLDVQQVLQVAVPHVVPLPAGPGSAFASQCSRSVKSSRPSAFPVDGEIDYGWGKAQKHRTTRRSRKNRVVCHVHFPNPMAARPFLRRRRRRCRRRTRRADDTTCHSTRVLRRQLLGWSLARTCRKQGLAVIPGDGRCVREMSHNRIWKPLLVVMAVESEDVEEFTIVESRREPCRSRTGA